MIILAALAQTEAIGSLVNSDKITSMKYKDVWSKGSDNQWIK